MDSAPATPPSDPPSSGSARLRRTNLLTAGLVLAILIASGVVAVQTLATPARSTDRFLPADGSTTAVWWQQGRHRSRASVENALLHGADIDGAFATSLLRQTAAVPHRSVLQTDWWREVVTANSFSDPSPRIRLRSVAADGIRLHAQDWGTRGVVFDPAPIELPAHVSRGAQWSSSGRAVVNAASLSSTASAGPERVDYQRRARVLEPTDPARAGQGCLTVSSTTTLGSASRRSVWTEDELWCPGSGVVSSGGSFAGTAYQLSPSGPTPPVEAALLRTFDPEPSATWKAKPLRFDTGDDTVGAQSAGVDSDNGLAGRTSTDQGCLLSVPSASGADELAGYPIGAGATWMHGWRHPGGSITAVGAIGKLTVVATDRRRLRSYDLHGRVRWTTDLPDITVVPPTPVGTDRLLVATVRGTVIMIDARTGRQLWRRQVSGAVDTAPIAGHGYVVVATGSTVTTLDAATGNSRWSQEVTGTFALATTGTIVAVLTYGTVTGYRVSDGQDRWHRSTNDNLIDVLAVGGRAVVVSNSGVEALDDSGRMLWQRRHAIDAAARSGEAILIADGMQVSQLTGSDGSTSRRWSAGGGSIVESQLLVCSAGALLVGRTTDFAVTGAWIGPIEDQQ